MIERAHLRHGVLDAIFLPVLFVPGETGAISTIPYTIVDNAA
jgi:hypothetical protein